MPDLSSSNASCELILSCYVQDGKLKGSRDGLTLGTTEAMSRAYVYAFLAFLASVLKVSIHDSWYTFIKSD